MQPDPGKLVERIVPRGSTHLPSRVLIGREKIRRLPGSIVPFSRTGDAERNRHFTSAGIRDESKKKRTAGHKTTAVRDLKEEKGLTRAWRLRW